MLNEDYKDMLQALCAEKVKDCNKRASGRTKDLADAEMLEGK
jgi:hypothetical protein